MSYYQKYTEYFVPENYDRNFIYYNKKNVRMLKTKPS